MATPTNEVFPDVVVRPLHSRTTSKASFAEPAITSEERAKRARNTVENIIPSFLRTSPRARHGIHKSEVISDPQPQREDSPTADDFEDTYSGRQICVRVKEVDTLTAARQMSYSSRRASMSANAPVRKIPNVCVLNQASGTRVGGGFIEGVHSQEEFLCLRSTLYASLWDRLYPLPDVGGIFSPDVLVFADSGPAAEEIQKRDRAYIDVISASMFRFPGPHKWQETATNDCSCGISYCCQHQDQVLAKMTAVLRMAQMNGIEKLVLGAWGCGVQGHPPAEIARAWKRVIFGTKRRPISWRGIKEVTFAVIDRPAFREFEKTFSDVMTTSSEIVPESPPNEKSGVDLLKERKEVDGIVEEIMQAESKVALSSGKEKAYHRQRLLSLSQRLDKIGHKENLEADEDEAREELEDGFVVNGYAASDVGQDEENSYYNFDENDVASSGSVTPASAYEFRYSPSEVRAQSKSVSDTDSYVHAVPESQTSSPLRRPARMNSFEQDVADRRRLEEADGWFSGSVNQLSALLKKTGGPTNAATALSPAEPKPDDVAFS